MTRLKSHHSSLRSSSADPIGADMIDERIDSRLFGRLRELARSPPETLVRAFRRILYAETDTTHERT